MAQAGDNGVFLNDFTFGIDLFKTGAEDEFAAAINGLTTNKKMLKRFEDLSRDPDKLVTQSPVAKVREERLRLVKPVVNREIVFRFSAELPRTALGGYGLHQTTSNAITKPLSQNAWL